MGFSYIGILLVLIAVPATLNLVTPIMKHDRKCATQTCVRPDCRCSHAPSPDFLRRDQTPQIVIFTFDDAVTKRDFDWYNFLFAPDRRNPNGCPITMTMFIQDYYTDYQLVNKLYKRGMEAAVHSVTHRVPIEFWKKPTEKDLRSEILDQRNNLYKKAGIRLADIKGWRSPFLQPSGELQFEILKQEGFLYDSTLLTGRRTASDNLWPFTLDYGWPLHCEVKPCPRDRYAGLWEVPIAPLLAKVGEATLSYPYVDSYRPSNGMAAYNFLKSNFLAYYKGNKEPFMLNMHTAWFYFGHNLYGMDLFIRELLTLDDVFIISVQQAIAWMKTPIPLKYTNTFKAWSCDKPKERVKSRVKPTMYVPPTTPPTTADPRAVQRAVKCVQGVNCLKGNCRCDAPFDSTILTTKEIPQIVLFTFDDAVNIGNENFYDKLFRRNRKNPNGCPITMTLFLQHKYTDYDIVRKLYDRGMEVAVHSVTHRYPNAWWRDASRAELIQEVLGMRRRIETYSGIPQNHVIGWRSPFLQPTADTLFKILQDYGFQYDATLSINRKNFESDQTWPFTLDYGWKRDCAIPKCPLNFYKGLWEFPVVPLINPLTKLPCSYVDSCRPINKTLSFNYLMTNFKSYYNGARAPFMLNMHAAWFLFDQNLAAMDAFIAEILSHKDVYILTVAQAMEWMKNPVPLERAKFFKPWACNWRPTALKPIIASTLKPLPSIEPRTIKGSTNKKGESSSPNKTGGVGVTGATPRSDGGGISRSDGKSGGDADSTGLDWYVILLIVLVVLALLIIGTLLIVSIVRKSQAVQVKRVAQLAASMAEESENEGGVDNPAVDRVKTLETLKTISGSRNNVNDNIYSNIMELRRTNPPVTRMSINETARPLENQPTARGNGHRGTSRNLPLPRPPSQEIMKNGNSKTQDTAKLVSGKSSSHDQTSRSRGKSAPTSARYEGDLESVRISVMDDLDEFSRNHSRMSLASVDNQYYSLDDPWLHLNLQGDKDKDSN